MAKFHAGIGDHLTPIRARRQPASRGTTRGQHAINIGQPGARYTETAVLWQTLIHLTFIVSAVGIAFVDRLGQIALAGRHKPEPAE